MRVVLCGPDGRWDHVVSHVGVALLGYWRIYVRMAARVAGIMGLWNERRRRNDEKQIRN